MTVTTVTHLNFRGEARAALAFYQSVFGGRLAVVSYADAGAVTDPAEADQVMWGEVRADNGFAIMAFDIAAARPYHAGENAFFVVVGGDDTDDVTATWERLADGATSLQPIGPAPWAPLYGMLKDRFGITWVLSVAAERG